jgi:hypothetical protein
MIQCAILQSSITHCYPSGLEKTLCNWDIYIPLVTKGLTVFQPEYEPMWLKYLAKINTTDNIAILAALHYFFVLLAT